MPSTDSASVASNSSWDWWASVGDRVGRWRTSLVGVNDSHVITLGEEGHGTMTTTDTAAAQPVEGTLFDVDTDRTDPQVGYRGPAVCQIAGITYHQLDYWTRTDLVAASVTAAAGSGSQQLYSFRDILLIKIIKSLLDAEISVAGEGSTSMLAHRATASKLTSRESFSDNDMVALLSVRSHLWAVALTP